MIHKIMEWFKITVLMIITGVNMLILTISIILNVSNMIITSNRQDALNNMQNVILDNVREIRSRFSFPTPANEDKELETQWKDIRRRYNDSVRKLQKDDLIKNGKLAIMPEEKLTTE